MKNGAERMVAALAVTAVLAGSVQAAAQDPVSQPTWKRALWVRSDALNRLHGLGDFKPTWKHALRIRSEELNRR